MWPFLLCDLIITVWCLTSYPLVVFKIKILFVDFLQVTRPDGKPETLGLVVLDEPMAKQSDPTGISWMRCNIFCLYSGKNKINKPHCKTGKSLFLPRKEGNYFLLSQLTSGNGRSSLLIRSLSQSMVNFFKYYFLFVYACCFSQVLCPFFVVLDLQLRTISKQTNLKAMVGLIMNCKKAFNDPWTNKKNSSVTKWALICGIMMQEGVQNAF